ncbi:hypothetical protein BTVI_157729 [Pitangus sulphuratus]|nr:hypothetical protein BTVI_157729 [Pitangus sulphuratus]
MAELMQDKQRILLYTLAILGDPNTANKVVNISCSGRETCDTKCEAIKKTVAEDLWKRAWDSDTLVTHGMNKFERINETVIVQQHFLGPKPVNLEVRSAERRKGKKYMQKLKALWKYPNKKSSGVASVVCPLLHFVPTPINGLIACCNSPQSLLYRPYQLITPQSEQLHPATTKHKQRPSMTFCKITPMHILRPFGPKESNDFLEDLILIDCGRDKQYLQIPRGQIDSNLTMQIKSPITFPKHHRTRTLPIMLQYFKEDPSKTVEKQEKLPLIDCMERWEDPDTFSSMRTFHNKNAEIIKSMVCCNPAVSQQPSPRELFSRSSNTQPPVSFRQVATSAALDFCSKSAGELAAGLAWQVEGDGHEGGVLLPQLSPPGLVLAEPPHLQRAL